MSTQTGTSRAASLVWLNKRWSDDYVIFTSRADRYWCARFRHGARPWGLPLSATPSATVIADSARELDEALAAEEATVRSYYEFMAQRTAILAARRSTA